MQQVELHRHLDVSLRVSTLLALAKDLGLEAQSTSIESFREKVFIRKPLDSLSTVLATFELFQKVLVTPETLERIGFEGVEDCYEEGSEAVEFRYSPGFAYHYSKFSWQDLHDALLRGIERACQKYPIRVGLICIASRDQGIESAEKTAEFFIKNQKSFVGFDLAGPEIEFPNRQFKPVFDRLRLENANITVHAGEAAGPENIWSAIEDLGAVRIGHGIRSIEDPKLMDVLRDQKICLEICPTSNYLTRSVESLAAHPLPELKRHGIPVSINTDDPGVFETTLPHELEICRSEMKLTEVEILSCLADAAKHSFLNL